jgi:vitamin B12 transporter
LTRAFAADVSTDINPVVVTATRTAQTADATLASVTVITRADIERLQVQSLQDLFVGLPGLSLTNYGGPGKGTFIYLRGAQPAQLLVLIDGIKIGSATLGLVPFEQIPVDQIDRIEIVRGPRASLYGSDAVGGVIQIFTRKESKGLTPSFSAGGGTYDTWRGQGGLSGSDGHAWFSTSVSGFQTKGINATQPAYYAYEPDADGYWNTAGSLRGGYRFDNGAEVSADWLRVYGHNRYDGAPYTNESGTVQQVLGSKILLPQIGFWQASFAAGQTEDQESDFGGQSPSDFDTLRNTASWQNDFLIAPRQQVTAGVDYLKDHIFSSTADFNRTSRENFGGYTQYQGGFGGHDVQLSVRGDRNQQFGAHWTGSAAWGYSFSRDLRVTASYGTAFRAPTFDDLYFPDYAAGVPAANPNLRPENSASGELGLNGRPGFWNWALNAYQTNVSDMITLDENFIPQNASHARLRGVDGQLGARWQQWQGTLYVSYLDPRNRTAGNHNNLLPRQPSQTARVDIDRDLGRFTVGGTVNAASRSFNDADNTQPLGGYATVDLRSGWQFNTHWLLQARLSNLFDHHYETVQYYNQPGRAVFFTLRYQPSRT